MDKKIFIVVAILVVVAGGYFLFRGNNQEVRESNNQEVRESNNQEVQESNNQEVQESNNQEVGESLDVDITSETTAREISMVSGNLFFNPKNLTLTKGQPVKITFTNSGVHTFTIDELGVNTALRGGSGVVEFTPTQSGTFEYYCTVPGHREGGMFGTLTVE